MSWTSCAEPARVVALAGDATLVFVGRSPESLFDYLSAAFANTSWRDRCVLFNISVRGEDLDRLLAANPAARVALCEHMSALNLDPASIASGVRPTTFIDFVASGETFGHVAGFLTRWAEEVGVDVKAVRRRLRFIGLTLRQKNSPKTWRWFQHALWATDYRPSTLKSVSVPCWSGAFLGNFQPKVARTNPPVLWGDEEMLRPPWEEEHLRALRFAAELQEQGSQPTERERFAAELAAQPQMRHRWLRSLVTELR